MRGVPLEQGEAPPEEVAPAPALPAAEPFSAKPTSVAGRSPVSISSRRTRIGLVVIVGLVVAYLVYSILPGGDSAGTSLALEMRPGAAVDYRIDFSFEGTAGVNGSTPRPFSVKVGGIARMDVASVEGGVATLDVTISAPEITVDPPPRRPIPVPAQLQGQLKVGPNGVITEGGLGLARVLAGMYPLPLGWDAPFPLLPDASVEEGGTWEESSSTGGEVTTTASSTYLAQAEDNPDLAVVSTETTTTYSLTSTLGELVAGSNLVPAQFPYNGADPAVTIEGTSTLKGNYWVSIGQKKLDHSTLTGTVDVTRTFTGLPESMGGTQTMVTSGDMYVRLAIARTRPKPPADADAKSPTVQTGA